MLRCIVLAMPPMMVILEVLLYAIDHVGLSFSGIPTANPPFRDIYILTINAACTKSALEFYTTGSCSDEFYGVPLGGFDYPILPFLIAKALPSILFASPDRLAIFFAAVFLVLGLSG